MRLGEPAVNSNTPLSPPEAGPADTAHTGTAFRSMAAVLIGLLGSLVIWVVTPYSNYYFSNSRISDDLLPPAAVFLVMLIGMGINPLLRLCRPVWAITGRQMAIIFAVMLVASVLPGHGVMQSLPYTLARTPVAASTNKLLADQYAQTRPPAALFPDPVVYNGRANAGDQFFSGLREGQSIPWGDWVAPAIAWGVFLLFAWAVMLGLSVIVLPQWRNNERLAFPLLTVEQAMIQEPEAGRLFAPLFRSVPFWATAGAVLLVHLLDCLHAYRPNAVPAIPLSWNLSGLMSEPPWANIAGHVRVGRIYFLFVGLAYFMPGRIAFSIWFFLLAAAVYRMIGWTYLPPFADGQFSDHRVGAMVAIAVAVVWIGRAHWRAVMGTLLRRAASDEDRRNRGALRLLIVGLVGLWAWLMWVALGGQGPGAHRASFILQQAGWSAVLVLFGFMVALLVSRAVAETGMPFWRIQADPIYLAKLAPMKWLSPVTFTIVGIVAMIFPMSSRVSPAAMGMQGLALVDEPRPRRQFRLAMVFLLVLVVGFVVSGATHLYMNYSNPAAANNQPINAFGRTQFMGAEAAVKELQEGSVSRPTHNAVGHIAFGAGLAGLLYWLSLTFPRWPLHPIGMLLLATPSYGDLVWPSILIGWVGKNLIVRYGGALAYRKARPVFLALILGEVFAAVLWAGVQLVLVNMGVTLRTAMILP